MSFIPDTLDEALERAEGYAKGQYSGTPHPLNSALLVTVIRELISLRSALPKGGAVPDREAFWLVERKVQPPQYVGTGSGFTTDPWRATRFKSEREAHDHWRTMTLFREESAPVEHMFINKA